jgi:hypothetical protein
MLMLAMLTATGMMATAARVPVQARTVPAGKTLDMLLQTPLSSATAKLDQHFDGMVVQELMMDGQVAVPSGAAVRGFIASFKTSGTVEHQGQITLAFDDLKIGEQVVKLRATVATVLDPKSQGPGDPTRTMTAPVIGANTGRGPAAFTGVTIGNGGTILSTNGSDVVLPAGVIVRIRLERPLEILK